MLELLDNMTAADLAWHTVPLLGPVQVAASAAYDKALADHPLDKDAAFDAFDAAAKVTATTAGKWTIEVCSPVAPDEDTWSYKRQKKMWEFATTLGAGVSPLTRAVADQTHNLVLNPAKYGIGYAIDYIGINNVPLPTVYKGQARPSGIRVMTTPVWEYEAYWDSSQLQKTEYTSDPHPCEWA